MKKIHTNGMMCNFEEMSGYEPYKSELELLDLYSGCGGMSTGLCLGAKLANVDLVTVNKRELRFTFKRIILFKSGPRTIEIANNLLFSPFIEMGC